MLWKEIARKMPSENFWKDVRINYNNLLKCHSKIILIKNKSGTIK
jgi:hypothetical protein